MGNENATEFSSSMVLGCGDSLEEAHRALDRLLQVKFEVKTFRDAAGHSCVRFAKYGLYYIGLRHVTVVNGRKKGRRIYSCFLQTHTEGSVFYGESSDEYID